jgi:hypothetical protein
MMMLAVPIALAKGHGRLDHVWLFSFDVIILRKAYCSKFCASAGSLIASSEYRVLSVTTTVDAAVACGQAMC